MRMDSEGAQHERNSTRAVNIPEIRPSRRRSPLAWTVGLLLSLGLLFGILSVAPLASVWSAMQGAAPGLAALAAAAAGVGLWFRGARWAVFFSPEHRVGAAAAAKVAIFGLALNAVLPSKLGEVARIGLAARRFQVSVRFVLATVVAERLLDALTLLALLGSALAALPGLTELGTIQVLSHRIEGDTIAGILEISVASFLGLTAVVVVLSLQRVRRFVGVRLSGTGPDWARPLTRWLVDTWLSLSAGFAKLRRPRSLASLLAYSLLIWGSLALCNWIAAFAVDGISLSFAQALVVTGLAVAAATLPSAPGGWGLFEAGVLMGVLGTGVEFEPAAGIAYAFVAHLCQLLPTVVAGLFLALGERWDPTSLHGLSRTASSSPGSETDRRTPETEGDGP